MEVYRIEHSTDPAVVGVSMQIRQFSNDNREDCILYPPKNEFGIFPFDTVFPIYRMERNAILTDLVSNVPLGNPLMISHRCLNLLEKFKLPKYQTFPLKFKQRGKLYENYVALAFLKDPTYINCISWENSLFYKTKDFHRTRISDYKIHSMEEFSQRKEELEKEGFGLYPEIRIRYPYEYDIINFNTFPLPFGYLCGGKVKTLITDAKLTGFKFERLSDTTFIDH